VQLWSGPAEGTDKKEWPVVLPPEPGQLKARPSIKIMHATVAEPRHPRLQTTPLTAHRPRRKS